MKILQHCLYFIICILVLSAHAYAQTGYDYIINMHNDTVKCELKSRLFNVIKYRVTKKDTLTEVSADSVKEYCFADADHPQVSVKITGDSERKFLSRLEKGTLCLYESITQLYGNMNAGGGFSGSKTIIYWYAAKNTTDSVLLIKTNQLFNLGPGRKQRQKDFANLLADHPYVFEKFNKAEDFGFKAIRAEVVDYNAAEKAKTPIKSQQ